MLGSCKSFQIEENVYRNPHKGIPENAWSGATSKLYGVIIHLKSASRIATPFKLIHYNITRLEPFSSSSNDARCLSNKTWDSPNPVHFPISWYQLFSLIFSIVPLGLCSHRREYIFFFNIYFHDDVIFCLDFQLKGLCENLFSVSNPSPWAIYIIWYKQ